MASVTPNCIHSILASPSPSDQTDFIVQVVDLKQNGNTNTRFTFMASDGTAKLKAMLPTKMATEVVSGKLQNLGLLRIKDFTCSELQNGKALIVIEADVVAPALDHEIGADEKKVSASSYGDSSTKPPISLKPKYEKKSSDSVLMSAVQIVQEQRGNAAPAARMGISRRVYPLVSLNPYQGNWTIKVRVTSKGSMRSFKNARGEGHVFNVELTDEDGTQIQATMFNEAADKFYPKLELGKVYFISKGSLRVANKQFSSVKNDYEMTLNAHAEVEEIADEETKIPELCYNIVKIDELGPHVNRNDLVDVLGVVQSVSGVVSIKRKINNDEIPKRDITIADESKKTVVVSLWNESASNEGENLLNMVHESPIILLKGLRVSDFQGVSLSATPKSVIIVNPDIPEAHKLGSWFRSEGKEAQLTSAGASLPRSGPRSMFADREFISEIIQPSVGQGKPAYFNVKAYISFIKPEQAMWYLACQSCNRKVTEDLGSSKFWCEGCQKLFDGCNRRYMLTVKVSDFSGEAWVSAFNEQSEHILGNTADQLAEIRSQDGEMKAYNAELKKVMWAPYVLRVSVAQSEYMNEKRQRITVRSLSTVVWEEESKYLIEQIAKLRNGS